MKLFKTTPGMKSYIDDVMTRVDRIIRTARPCVPESVSTLEYIYMLVVEAFDETNPEPRFTTDDFGWADLVHYVEHQNACDLLAIAVVLATLKPQKADYCGWDTNHNLTYDVDEALRLWEKLYRDVIRRIIYVNRGASADESKLSDLLDTIDVRVKMYVPFRDGDREYTKVHLVNPFNGIAWYGEGYRSTYYVDKNIPWIGISIMDTPIVDIASIDDIRSIDIGTSQVLRLNQKLMETRVSEIISSHVGSDVSWGDWFPAIIRDTPVASALWHDTRNMPRKGYSQYTYDQFLIDAIMCDDARDWIMTLLYFMSYAAICGKQASWERGESFNYSTSLSSRSQTKWNCQNLIASSKTIPEAVGKFRCRVELYDDNDEWVGYMDPNTKTANVMTEVKF